MLIYIYLLKLKLFETAILINFESFITRAMFVEIIEQMLIITIAKYPNSFARYGRNIKLQKYRYLIPDHFCSQSSVFL